VCSKQVGGCISRGGPGLPDYFRGHAIGPIRGAAVERQGIRRETTGGQQNAATAMQISNGEACTNVQPQLVDAKGGMAAEVCASLHVVCTRREGGVSAYVSECVCALHMNFAGTEVRCEVAACVARVCARQIALIPCVIEGVRARAHVCPFMCACVHVCVRVCTCVSSSVCMRASMGARALVCACFYKCVWVHVHSYVRVFISVYEGACSMCVFL